MKPWPYHLSASLRILLFCLASQLSAAEALPDWMRSGLTPDLGEWSQRPAVVTHHSHLVRFTSAEQAVETTRVVMRIATAIGRRDAKIVDVFNPGTEKIINAAGWVLGKDGRVQKHLKRADYMENFITYNSVMWDQDRSLSLDLGPEVELGGYVAFEIEKQSINPLFEVNHFVPDDLPLVGSTLEVIPPANGTLQWFSTLRPAITPSPGSSPGALLWTVPRQDQKTAKLPENYIPRLNLISVRCSRSDGGSSDRSGWSALGEGISRVMSPACQPDDIVRAKALALTQGKSSRWDRIRALCEFVQRDIRYIQITIDTDYLAGYRPHPAPEVLEKRYGDCKDKVALLIALLDAIGETGQVLAINAGNPLAAHEEWPSPKWFNHAIIGIEAGSNTPEEWPFIDRGAAGKIIVFDPTHPIAPLGVLPAYDQGGWALLIDPLRSQLLRLPVHQPAQNVTHQQINAKIDPDLLLKIHVRTTQQGPAGAERYTQRLFAGNVLFGRTLEAELHRSFALIDHLTWTDAWDNQTSKHTIDQRFSSRSFTKPLGPDRAMVLADLLASDFALPKLSDFDGHISIPASRTIKSSTLKLPPDWTVANLPTDFAVENQYLSWKISYATDEDKIICHADITQPGIIADLKTYELIWQARQQLHEWLSRPTILQKIRTNATPAVVPEPSTKAVSP